MGEELRFPDEGMATLGAQFTSTAVRSIVDTVRRMRKKGWGEEQVLRKMKQDLRAFDAHTLQRLYDKAADRPVADDINAANVVAERQVKRDTVEVDVHSLVFGIQPTGLVQYKGADWYVAGIREKTYILKRLG